jgi:hypothetical protein
LASDENRDGIYKTLDKANTLFENGKLDNIQKKEKCQILTTRI